MLLTDSSIGKMLKVFEPCQAATNRDQVVRHLCHNRRCVNTRDVAIDDIPEHLFRISEVHEDCVGGYSITGPLAGEYGEPSFDLILKVHEG